MSVYNEPAHEAHLSVRVVCDMRDKLALRAIRLELGNRFPICSSFFPIPILLYRSLVFPARAVFVMAEHEFLQSPGALWASPFSIFCSFFSTAFVLVLLRVFEIGAVPAPLAARKRGRSETEVEEFRPLVPGGSVMNACFVEADQGVYPREH